MNTFFNILQTIINKKNKTYPDETFIHNDRVNYQNYTDVISYIDFFINNMFYNEKNSRHSVKIIRYVNAKFSSLNSILENIFIKNDLKETILSIFSRSQKYYYAFSRLVRIYKVKKYPMIVNEDLMLNKLDINHKNTFILIEHKSKYLFSLNDLISIIEISISNSPDFFPDPLSPLNPYNKIPFTDSMLYNIYFKMKESGRLTSILFHLFFLENFNKKKFCENNEPFIREYAIKTYVYNSPYTTLHSSIFIMLENNPYTNKYNIHKDFPKDLLVDIFRPFLFHYFIINYGFKQTSKFDNYQQILFYKLKKFYEYNPLFGRAHMTITSKFGRIIKKERIFNTKHICFHKINSNNYDALYIIGNLFNVNAIIADININQNAYYDNYTDGGDDNDDNTDEENL